MKMSRLKRNLAIAFVCCVTLGICAVGFAQPGEEEETVQGDLDNYTLQIQENIEAMMACGDDCAGISIEPLSFEEMIKDMQENDVSQSDDLSSSSEEESTRGGICSATSSTVTCTNNFNASYEYVAVDFPPHSTELIVCTSTDGSNWSLDGWQTVTTQNHLYVYGGSHSESIGIVRYAQTLDDDCDFGNFPNWFTRQIVLAGMSGTDTVHGSQYMDTLYGEYVLGHEGVDSINLNYVAGITPGAWGGNGDDYIEGNANDDYIDAKGTTDDDWCYGGTGNDDCPDCENANSCTP
jgi:hypothetical protein